jgi:hypothetical protein
MLDMLIASALTLFLGPGVGHLFIREFKKAVFFISGSLAIVFVFAIYISKYIVNKLPAGTDAINFKDSMQLLNGIYSQNPGALRIFEIAFAAFWAYSIADVIMSSLAKNQKNKDGSENPPDNEQ